MEDLIKILLLEFLTITASAQLNITSYWRRGENVTLSCPNPTNSSWTFNFNTVNSGLTINPNLPNSDRLIAIIDTTRNSIDLHIRNVTDIDEGQYKCLSPGNTNNYVQLFLYVEPYPPVILNTTQGGSYIEGTEGQQLSMMCQSYNGKPPADVTWKTGTTNLATNKNTVTYQLTTSRNNHLQTYTCVSNSAALSSPRQTSVQLLLNLRPLSPVVTVSSVREGDNIIAQCTSTGSRPAAILSWSIDGVLQSRTGQQQTIKDTATQTYNVSLQYRKMSSRSDNTKNLVCRANNTVVPGGITGQQQLNVWFGPDSVTISGSSTMNENTVLSLTCNASLSNPQSTLTWYKNGSPFTVSGPVSTQNGDYGGKTTHQTYSTTVRRQDNGANITCVATSTARSAVNSVILNVRYKPTVQIQPSTQTVVEGSTNIMFSCVVTDGNPRTASSYSWRKGGNQIGTGQTYTIQTVSRSHNGSYNCNGTNVAGTSDKATSTLVVLYHANITSLTIQGGSTHNESTDVSVNCTVDSYPHSNVTWSSTGERPPSTLPANPSSILLLRNISCYDTANYTCSAFNGYGTTSVETRTLYVRCTPRLPTNVKEVVELGLRDGENLTISSVYVAYPEPIITWNFRAKSQNTSNQIGQPQVEQIGLNIFRSNFSKDVKDNEFGEYKSVANNNAGSRTGQQIFKVDANRSPSVVKNISAECLTSSTANISWIPGFDGGLPQWFNIMYRPFTTDTFTSSSNISNSGHGQFYIIFQLGANTIYFFKLKSSNSLGHVFSSEVNCETDEAEQEGRSDAALVGGVAGTSAAIILIIVVIVVVLLFRKMQNKKREDEKELSERSLASMNEIPDGIKDNILYESAGNDFSQQRQDVYAEVVKPKKKGAAVKTNDVYAEVEKSKKTNNKKKQKGYDNKVMTDVYENVSDFKGGAKQQDGKSSNQNPAERGYRNEDGLLYVDVAIKPSADGRKNVIIGEEERTDYASVDFVVPP